MVATRMTYCRVVPDVRKLPNRPLFEIRVPGIHCGNFGHIIVYLSFVFVSIISGDETAKMSTVLTLDGGGWSITSGDGNHTATGNVPGYALQALVEVGKEEDPLKG